MRLAGVCQAPQITANVNDYSPDGFYGAGLLIISSDAARDITGIFAGAPLQCLVVINTGAFTITLKNSSVASAPENQFVASGDFGLLAGGAVQLVYDPVNLRWHVAGGF